MSDDYVPFVPPRPTWRGFDQNRVRKFTAFKHMFMYRRVVDLQDRIRTLDRQIEQKREELSNPYAPAHDRRYARRVRCEYVATRERLHSQLKATSARLACDDAADEVDYICSLPNVMGMRFDHDGTPCVHYRAILRMNGAQYYLGDYEVYFRYSADEETGAFNVYGTSVSHGVFSTYYQQYSKYTRQDTWFCFGVDQRNAEIHDAFQQGDFRRFVNLAFHTMCSVNDGHRDRAPDEYVELAPGYVWTPHRMHRNRPRRRHRMSSGA